MQKMWSVLFGVVMLAALLLFIVAPWVGWVCLTMCRPSGRSTILFGILAVTVLFHFTETSGLRHVEVHGPPTAGRNTPTAITGSKWSGPIPGIILLVIAVVQVRTWAEVNSPRTCRAQRQTCKWK